MHWNLPPRLRSFASLGILLAAMFLPAAEAQNPLEWLRRDREPETFPGSQNSTTSNRETSRRYGFRATERGKGTLGIKGPNLRLEEASVTLGRDGRAEFLLRGERVHRLSGTWRRGPGHQAVVTIDRAYGRTPATGTGTVTLHGNTFSRIDLKGESVAFSGDYNARFQVGDENASRPPAFRLDATERGRGSMGISGPNKRLEEARVVLRENGDVRLFFTGEERHEFSGTWSRGEGAVIDLHLTRGPDRRPMLAQGTLSLTRGGGSFSQVELLGHSDSLGGRVRVSFDTSDAPDSDTPQRPGSGYSWELRGNGTLGMAGPNRKLERATVTLDRRGRARIILSGGTVKPHEILANWSRTRDGDITFDVYEIFQQRASGKGRLYFDGDRLIRLECRGSAAAYDGSFNARLSASDR